MSAESTAVGWSLAGHQVFRVNIGRMAVCYECNRSLPPGTTFTRNQRRRVVCRGCRPFVIDWKGSRDLYEELSDRTVDDAEGNPLHVGDLVEVSQGDWGDGPSWSTDVQDIVDGNIVGSTGERRPANRVRLINQYADPK